MYNQSCVNCKGKKSSKDPHPLWLDCTVLCGVSAKCEHCAPLSPKSFSAYLQVSRKRVTQRLYRRRMSSAEEPVGEKSPVNTAGAVLTSTPVVTTVTMTTSAAALTTTAVSSVPSLQTASTPIRAPGLTAPSTSGWVPGVSNDTSIQQTLALSGMSQSYQHYQAPYQGVNPMQYTAPQTQFVQPAVDVNTLSSLITLLSRQQTPAPQQAPQLAVVSTPPAPVSYQSSVTQLQQAPVASAAPAVEAPTSPGPSFASESSTRSHTSRQRVRTSRVSDRSRSPVRRSPSSEREFVPDYDEEMPDNHLGMDHVYDWIADRLVFSCPSPGPGVDETLTIWEKPSLMLPTHAKVREILSTLDEDFSKLSLNPTIRAPKCSKDEYPVHGLNFTWSATSVDEEIKKVTGSSSISTYKVQDSKMTALDLELKRMLRPLSALASATDAILQDLSENNPDRIDHLTTVMDWQNSVINDLREHLRTALANTCVIRRLGFLSYATWESEFQKKLFHQPWSATTLFNGAINDVYKEVTEYAKGETALKNFQQAQRSNQPTRANTYQPRRPTVIRARKGSFRGKGRGGKAFPRSGYQRRRDTGRQDGRKGK